MSLSIPTFAELFEFLRSRIAPQLQNVNVKLNTDRQCKNYTERIRACQCKLFFGYSPTFHPSTTYLSRIHLAASA